jgi:hypothetical protein
MPELWCNLAGGHDEKDFPGLAVGPDTDQRDHGGFPICPTQISVISVNQR